jgi:hypothetical protein
MRKEICRDPCCQHLPLHHISERVCCQSPAFVGREAMTRCCSSISARRVACSAACSSSCRSKRCKDATTGLSAPSPRTDPLPPAGGAAAPEVGEAAAPGGRRGLSTRAAHSAVPRRRSDRGSSTPRRAKSTAEASSRGCESHRVRTSCPTRPAAGRTPSSSSSSSPGSPSWRRTSRSSSTERTPSNHSKGEEVSPSSPPLMQWREPPGASRQAPGSAQARQQDHCHC